MKRKMILILLIIISFFKSTSSQEDIFTKYCQPDLCKNVGGIHSGCKLGLPHDMKLQRPDCPDNAEIIPLTASIKQLIVDFLNVQRNFVACGGLYKRYGIGPGCRHGVVTWDNELEKTAFLHSSYCDFNHDECRSTVKYPFSGQTVGVLTYGADPRRTNTYINIIFYLWYLQYTSVKKDMINLFYHHKQQNVSAFFTSMNERNNRVGCSFVKFFNWTKQQDVVMLSCNYPTTSIIKGVIYNSCKEPASKCTKGTDPKYKFLCSSEEIYDVSDILTPIPYDGDGSEVFDNCGQQPELYHYSREGANSVREFHEIHYPYIAMPVEKPEGEPKKNPMEITTEKPISGTTKKPAFEKPEKDSVAAVTTVKPALQKPQKDSTAAVTTVKPAVEKPEKDSVAAVATVKPALQKPQKDSTAAVTTVEPAVEKPEKDSVAAVATVKPALQKPQKDSTAAVTTVKPAVEKPEKDSVAAVAPVKPALEKPQKDSTAAVTTLKPAVEKPEKDSATSVTTVKPAVQKPEKDSGKPAFPFPESNSEEGGITDHSEDQFDPPDSSSVMLWHECFYQSIFYMFLILFIF